MPLWVPLLVPRMVPHLCLNSFLYWCPFHARGGAPFVLGQCSFHVLNAPLSVPLLVTLLVTLLTRGFHVPLVVSYPHFIRTLYVPMHVPFLCFLIFLHSHFSFQSFIH